MSDHGTGSDGAKKCVLEGAHYSGAVSSTSLSFPRPESFQLGYVDPLSERRAIRAINPNAESKFRFDVVSLISKVEEAR
jgi:hypothetical protein